MGKTKALSARIVDVDAQTESIKKVKIEEYFDGIIQFFPLLAVKIEEGENEIIPSLDWYDNLDFEDADKIYNFIFDFVNKKK